MYTDCKQQVRVLYIFWAGVKGQNLSFRPITIAIGIAITKGNGNAKNIINTATIGTTFTNANANAIGNANTITITITITIANSIAIGNGDGTPRREYLWCLHLSENPF